MAENEQLREIDRWLEELRRDSSKLQKSELDPATDVSGRMPAPDVAFIQHLDSEGRVLLVQRLADETDLDRFDASNLNAGLRRLVAAWSQAAAANELGASNMPVSVVEALAKLYKKLQGNPNADRHWLLSILAQLRTPQAWAAFADLVVTDPPTDGRKAIEAMIPLWRATNGPYQSIFPRLLDGLEQPVIAPLALDLANFLHRSARVERHPVADQLASMTTLLGNLIERLEGFEQSSQQQGVENLDVAKQVTESVSLAASLCDTLALNLHHDAAGKLYRMMELRHRRLRIEAAAALARFGEEAGIETLIEMASEPLVRLRAVEYARELEVEDRVPEKFRSPVALAEAELVVRLSEPDLFGIPPLSIELVDQTVLHWPSFEEPRDCFLFRYHYQFAQGDFENLGLVGPVAHTFPADLTVFPLGDVYGVFAGWHAEHAELQRFAVDGDTNLDGFPVSEHARRLGEQGYDDVKIAFGATYFGDEHLVTQAVKQGVTGTIVANQSMIRWIPDPNPERPLDPDLAYSMVIGRDMLNRFNHGFDEYDQTTA